MVYKKLLDWQINASYPYGSLLCKSAETGMSLSGIFNSIPAKVPGSIHHDLLEAGIIKNPYFEMNSLDCQWVSEYWWTYYTTFEIEIAMKGQRFRLRLNGIDYEAMIYVNDKLVGTHKGMYVPFACDITNLLRYDSPNSISVVLKNAPKEFGQYGLTELTSTQKARFTYKWDFGTRMVHLGLYDEVLVEHFYDVAIEYSRIHADASTGLIDASVMLTVFEAGEQTICWEVLKNDCVLTTYQQVVLLEEGNQQVKAEMSVAQPQKWYPNGAGDHPLYTLRVTIGDKTISDQRAYSFGFRTIQYFQAEGASNESLPYGVNINGKAIYIKGVNMVPMDMMYGSVTFEQREQLITLVRNAGINLIRVWGGGLIECEEFYDLCDRNGILVWQDFIQSGSGISNVPSKLPEFITLCRNTAVEAVMQKQHHASLAFWCGGNELTDELGVPAHYEDENIRMLQEIVSEYDGVTMFLPTTASGPREFLNIDAPGTNHDVHGPWQYDGPIQHYTNFNSSDSILHSEFGIPGMSSYDTIQSVLSPANFHFTDCTENIVWRYHAEWWDTSARDSSMFGPFQEDELEAFISCSQFVQADGLRYALESNRRRAFANVGSIIWQLNEPWPQISGTNLVDYYLNPKPAYYAVQLAYRSVNPSLQYDKLIYEPGETASLRAWLSSGESVSEWTVQIAVLNEEEQSLMEQTKIVIVGDGRSVLLEDWQIMMPTSGTVYVQLIASSEMQTIVNLYPLFIKDQKGYANRQDAINFSRKYRQLCRQ
jgi:beta-mannosidase